jgi:hypothetical protein
VPIPSQLVPPLRKHFEDQDAERQAAGDRWQDWDLVWCEPDGRPIDPHDDWEVWKALLAEAGITKDARLHDARHTSGTLPGEQHVDLHVIQRILGHAQVSTTRIYTDPTDLLTREAVGRIGSALWPDAAQPQRGMQLGPATSGQETVETQVRTGAPPGTRTPNPRIKRSSGACSPEFMGVRAAAQTPHADPGELGRTAVNCNPNCNPERVASGFRCKPTGVGSGFKGEVTRWR